MSTCIRGLVAATALLALAAGARADTLTKGFDDVGAPPAFKFIVPGFVNGPVLQYDEVTLNGGVILNDALFGNAATSGDNILATCDTCNLGDNPPSGLPGVIRGVFVNTVDQIDLDVINGSTASGGTFTLSARNADGDLVGSDSVFLTTLGSAGGVGHLSVSGEGMVSFRVETSLSFYTFAIDTLVFHEQEGTWDDLGLGLAGTHGVPALAGSGSLIADEPLSLSLSGALESATTYLVVSPVALDFFPFYGGTLVPDPDTPGTFFTLLTDGAGELHLPAAWPAGIPPGFELYLQAWVIDGGGPFGFAASNALRATTP